MLWYWIHKNVGKLIQPTLKPRSALWSSCLSMETELPLSACTELYAECLNSIERKETDWAVSKASISNLEWVNELFEEDWKKLRQMPASRRQIEVVRPESMWIVWGRYLRSLRRTDAAESFRIFVPRTWWYCRGSLNPRTSHASWSAIIKKNREFVWV